MATCWYALRSKPHKESFLYRQLQANKIETFYPQVRVQTVNPRARKIKPYFPGYLFIQVDIDEIGFSTFHWTPGSAGLVTFGGDTPVVPDGLIAAIRRRVNDINAAGGELFVGLKPGDKVIVEEGPFAGYEAIFDARLSGTDRVRVFLKMLNQQQLPTELPAGQIRRKS